MVEEKQSMLVYEMKELCANKAVLCKDERWRMEKFMLE
jgi:hypothetical protein